MSPARSAATPPDLPIVHLLLRTEADVVLVRQRARLISELLGFSPVDQTRNATAVSEIARNAILHGGGGRIRYSISGSLPRALQVTVEDSGTGLAELQRSTAGGGQVPGRGLEISRRLMDRFEFRSREQGGTTVEMIKLLPRPRQATGAAEVRALVDELLRRPPESLLEELHLQQQELLAVLDRLTAQQERLQQVNAELEETNRGVMALYSQVTQELEDTNRGVLALYAQLDDQASELQRVNQLKDRFLSHLSHEFRTPLNSTLALARLLLDRADGPLGAEQERQIGFVYEGARELLGMVNDLLDLAKIEAGRLDANPERFSVDDLFSALRGMFRPIAAASAVELTFAEVPPDFPLLDTDQQKVARILRNLISNALKFTEAGGVRVSAHAPDADTIVFEVRDTGIGVPSDRIERIFQEFEQVAGPRQRQLQGTGLGLPLSVELAALLGGTVKAESTFGHGSTFRLQIPRSITASDDVPAAPSARQPRLARYATSHAGSAPARPAAAATTGPIVLVIDDDPASRYLLEHTLAAAGYSVAHATSGREALQRARELKPEAIFVDLGLPDGSGLQILRELEADPGRGDRPIIVYASRRLPDADERLLTGFALRIVTRDDLATGQPLGSIGAALVRMTEQPRKGNA